MSEGDATISREEQMLGELAELDLTLAREAHAKALGAEDADQFNAFSRTYQRIARSVRQSLVAKAKLAREREAAEAQRPPRPEPKPIHPHLRLLNAAQRARVDQAFGTVRPYVERERPDWNELDDVEIYEVLIDMADDEDFLDAPMDDLVARALMTLGCRPPAPPRPEPADPRPPAGAKPAIQDSA